MPDDALQRLWEAFHRRGSPGSTAEEIRRECGLDGGLATIREWPFFRLQQLQRSMGVPLPASVQWQLVQQKAQSLKPIYEALLRHAAQGELMRVDDTTMTILERDGRGTGSPECPIPQGQKKDSSEKKATHTTAIVSSGQDRQVVLYTTGA